MPFVGSDWRKPETRTWRGGGTGES
jgi:hypothetical protein